jgi:aspartyl-tRNA synthetase
MDVTEIVKKSDFKVFQNAEQVVCINPEKDFSRKELDKYGDLCVKEGAKGLAWLKITEKGFEGSIAKFISEDVQKELLKLTKAKKGSVLMFVADKKNRAAEYLGSIRLKLGQDLGLVNEKDLKFVWITRFPLFENKEGSWKPMHHIFSMPHEEFIGKMEKDPAKVTGKLYDLALNGTELGGGSIRIHRKDIQEEALKVIGMDYKEAEKRFGFLLNAFKYGAPPHGGIAFGLDRICALLNGIKDIREVIAFPKNKNAENPMDGCPTEIDQEQLDELNIQLKK